MKVFHLTALFGGAVSAVQPLVGRDDGTTTAVVYVTSTYTITKCAASVTNCPAASATELFTSTTVMSVTTTICPVTSTPGGLPPANTDTLSDSVPTSYRPDYPGVSSIYVPGYPSLQRPTGISVSLVSSNPSVPISGASDSLSTTSSLFVQTSALPTGSVGSDRPTPSGLASLRGSLTDSVPTSFAISLTASTVGYAPSQPLSSASPGTYTDAIPTSGVTTSGVYDQPSAPSSNTDAVPTSGYPGSSRPSSNTDAVPTSGYPDSSALTASTGTDAVPTSGYPGSSALTASTGTDAIPTSLPVYPSGSVSAIPSITSASSGLVYPVPTPPGSTPITDSTTGITSRLTLTSTSYVTAPLPVNTETDAVPTSGANGYLPSGSGYPYPSNSANGTIVTPTPSYIEVPVNIGQIVAAGQGPIVAIVVALAFALFA